MGSAKPDLPVIAFKSQQDWDAWLTSQRTRSKGLWLKLAKKASGVASVSKQEAIDAALCHGWIDGQLDRRWNGAYASQSTAQVPDDLRAALEKNGKAKRFFETLDSRNRYAILYRIHNVKKAETRIARIEQFVTMLFEGKTLYPLKSGR